MAALTIRQLPDELKARLRQRAASNGRSMEEEVRVILSKELGRSEDVSLGSIIQRRFAEIGGIDLELPPRGPAREPPDFDDHT